jgi:Peptidase M10 serralysin C terminal
MISSAQIQLIRNADPGAVLPGIDTPTGNPDPTSSLMDYTEITQNPEGAPYVYEPAKNVVLVTQNGAVLNGINFGSATLVIAANNVTVKDCTFTGTTSYWAISQSATASNTTVENCTFQGSESPTEINDWIAATQSITIKDNSFLDSPTDAIDIRQGVVTGNYFSGAGFAAGAHSDAIWVTDSTGPTTITDNFIDGTYTAAAAANANSDIRLTTEEGNLSNVTVSGNWLLGGGYTVETGNGANLTYAFSNISVTNNYIGYYWYGAYWNGNSTIPSSKNIVVSGNPIISYSNPVASTQALAAYKSGVGMPTNLIAATTVGQTLTSASSAPTTLLGDDLATNFFGSTNETDFVSGYGGHHLTAGLGANIFTYLAISDSTPASSDTIYGFDPAKDVIDLSRIDANITTPGLQHFTFIGSAPLSGNGAQVRYQLDPARDITYVEADLASDSATDFEVVLMGLVPLSASNFALTSAQSAADIANGAALGETKVQTPAGGAPEYAYTNVKGESYSVVGPFENAALEKRRVKFNIPRVVSDKDR